MDVGEFLSYVDAEIANPNSARGWIDYCNKVRGWVVQKYKIVEASYPKKKESQEVEVSQEVLAQEENPEVLEEVGENAANILASSFSQEVSEAQSTLSEPLGSPPEKKEPEPETEPAPHEGITVYETTQSEILTARESKTLEDSEEMRQREARAKKHVEERETRKALRHKKESSLPIPQGLSAGWILSMVIAMCFLLPWVWLVLNLFWTIISKLLPKF